jgi:FkbM family methyltransferase
MISSSRDFPVEALPPPLPLMLSYSQNGEDVLLRRVLRDVKAGFYIDVGAQDPTVDSVTKYFYDGGWRGINVEPHPHYFAKLQRERPRDINLNVAVSNQAGIAQFHFIDKTGRSSLSEDAVRAAEAQGLHSKAGSITTETLTKILTDRQIGEIHFMKIDVEGAENAVLSSIDFSRWRPWVIVVEATLPDVPTPCWDDFEQTVLQGGYQAVLFDGLNRWYLRNESMSLAPRFTLPINVFDRYKRWRRRRWDPREALSKLANAVRGRSTV